MSVSVTKVSPLGEQIARTQPVVIDVTGTLELSTRFVFLRLGSTQVLVHDGVSFLEGFETFSSVATLVAGRSYRYTVIPNSGWLASPEVTASATETEIEAKTPEGSIDFAPGANSLAYTNATTGDFDQDDPFSLSFWVKIAGTKTHKIINKLLNSGAFTGWFLGDDSSLGYFDFSMMNNFGAGVRFVNRCATSYDIAGWQHWVMAYDGTGPSGVAWYHQGLPVSGAVIINGLGAASVLNAANLQLGGWGVFGQTVNGKLSAPALFDKQLSAAEVVELYAGGAAVDITGLSFEGDLVNAWGMLDNQDAFPVAIDKRYTAHATAIGGAIESSDTPWP